MTNWIKNEQVLKKQELHDAAEHAYEFQQVMSRFVDGKTPEIAQEVIQKGEKLLEYQNQVGTNFINPTSVRHRIMVAETYLADRPVEKKTASSDGIWEHYIDENGHKVQKLIK